MLVAATLQVSVVGIIRRVAPFATYIQYSVDDMTGPPLKVKLWIHSEVGNIDSHFTRCIASFNDLTYYFIPPGINWFLSQDCVFTLLSSGTYVKVLGTVRNSEVRHISSEEKCVF